MTTSTISVEAFLCDGVEAVGGKLYALGIGWNTIHATSFPARHPRVGVGVVIHVPYTATNQQHEFFVQIDSEDGNVLPLADAGPGADPRTVEDGKVVRLGGQFNVGRPPGLPHGYEQLVTLAFQLDGVEFPAPGRYVVTVTVDGSVESQLSFALMQVTQMQIP